MVKNINIPENCVGAVQTALRIRIIYLQSYRERCERDGYKQASDAIMKDVANLKMIADTIDDTPVDMVMREERIEANQRRFALTLAVPQNLQKEWLEAHVEHKEIYLAGTNRVLDVFNDSRYNQVMIFNEHGVPIYQNFQSK